MNKTVTIVVLVIVIVVCLVFVVSFASKRIKAAKGGSTPRGMGPGGGPPPGMMGPAGGAAPSAPRTPAPGNQPRVPSQPPAAGGGGPQ
ncbi:MAG: hypothetical protein J7M26_10085 [Armatimonadetes bacterium]|nr:hypothetical protein [Armatimonadota bacterium]